MKRDEKIIGWGLVALIVIGLTWYTLGIRAEATDRRERCMAEAVDIDGLSYADAADVCEPPGHDAFDRPLPGD